MKGERTADVVLSVIFLLCSSPLWLLIACAIKLTSKGPVFFIQKRSGLRGELFEMPKFRTMYAGTGLEPPDFIRKGDPRVTPVGKILRATRLDEIPQLLNVLRGHMSLVGPRALPPQVITLWAEEIPRYKRRLTIKPGITGLPQIRHWSSNDIRGARLSFHADIRYIQRRYWKLYFWILIQTFFVMCKHRGE